MSEAVVQFMELTETRQLYRAASDDSTRRGYAPSWRRHRGLRLTQPGHEYRETKAQLCAAGEQPSDWGGIL